MSRLSTINQIISIFCYLFFFNDTATTEIYTLSLHDALPISFVTMAVAVPLRFWLVAVIVADPAAMPVMRPLVLTVATAGLVLDHVTLTATLSPFFVFPYAVNCAARPTDTNAVLGVSTTCASKPRFFTREVADTCVVPEAAVVGAVGVG